MGQTHIIQLKRKTLQNLIRLAHLTEHTSNLIGTIDPDINWVNCSASGAISTARRKPAFVSNMLCLQEAHLDAKVTYLPQGKLEKTHVGGLT